MGFSGTMEDLFIMPLTVLLIVPAITVNKHDYSMRDKKEIVDSARTATGLARI